MLNQYVLDGFNIMKTQEKLTLNIRDIALRDLFTASEKLNFITLFVLFIIVTCNFDNRSIWTSCFVLVIASSSLINIKIHGLVHPFVIDKLWSKLIYLNLPVIFLMIIYLLTALGNCVEPISINGFSFMELRKPENIFSTNVTFKNNWILFLSTISLFSISTHLLIIPKSLYFINKLLSWFCNSLYLMIFAAYVLKAGNFAKPLFASGTGQSDYFFYFPYDGDWAAFAILWIYVSYAISIIEYEKNDRKFIHTKAPFYLILCVLIGSTTLVIKESVSSLFLSFALVHICYLTYRYFKKENELGLKFIKPCIFLLGIGSTLKGLYTFGQINVHSSLIEKLKDSGFEMIADSPLFGWGINCFQALAPYYNDASLINNRYEAIPSSIINFLCEFGFIGTIIICLLPIILYYLYQKKRNSFSDTLFFPMFLICILSFFDHPFYSIPVTFSFWIIGFFAIRWAQLIYDRPDEVDTGENLITSDHFRKVPFVTNPKKEVFK